MRERHTVRVLLLDPRQRLLLMKGRLAHAPDAPGQWFTIGGGVEAGESLMQAAAREIAEETGFTDVAPEGPVWRREVLAATGQGDPMLVRETYVLARCGGGEPSRDGWDALERSLIDDIAWWSLEEMARAEDEVFHPPGVADHLARLLAEGPPAEALILPADRWS